VRSHHKARAFAYSLKPYIQSTGTSTTVSDTVASITVAAVVGQMGVEFFEKHTDGESTKT